MQSSSPLPLPKYSFQGFCDYTQQVIRLIVNADDFGYTPGINRAIAMLGIAGALSSTTVMAVPGACSSSQPGSLGVGCHVVLVDGHQPCSSAAGVPSLLGSAPGTHFRPSLSRFAAALLRGHLLDREIEAEAVAQIRALQVRGLRLTHVDTHKHTHLFPRVLRPLLRAALQCGIRAVRNPFEPTWARSATVNAPLLRRAQVRLLHGYQSQFLREVDRAGMRTTAGALGVLATGMLNASALRMLLKAVEHHARLGECYELVCHPGFHDAELDAQPTRLQAQREVERAALLETIPAWAAVKENTLLTFADL